MGTDHYKEERKVERERRKEKKKRESTVKSEQAH